MHEVYKSRLRLTVPLVLLALAAPIVYGITINLQNGDSLTTPHQVIFQMAVLGMALFLAYFLKKSPKVIISNQFIRVGRRDISIEDIAEIEIYSSVNLSLFANTEISTIQLKNGERIRFYLENYSNGNLIRLNLHNIKLYVTGKTEKFRVTSENLPETNYNTDGEDFTVYRQSAIKSVYYWVLFPFIILFAFLGLRGTGSLAGQIVVFGFASGMLLLLVFQSRYFMVSHNYLVIKNYLMPWWSKTFRLSDIDHIRTFTASRAPAALNIVTTSFKHYRYPSGFMSLKMYDELTAHILEHKEAVTPKPETTA